MSYAIQNGGGNSLLASLPSEDSAYLTSISRIAHPATGSILANRSEPTTELWFPHRGIVALTATDAEGRSVQTAVVGSEGCAGLDALFEGSLTLPDAVVQIEGPMSVIAVAQIRPALVARPAIHAALSRFLYTLSAQSLQTIACNRMHSLPSRCCRWLLTMQDRLSSNELRLTQESLATLLGSGRPRINGLLAKLEQDGLLRRHRGWIRLLERRGLETLSCDCYRVSKY